MDDFMFVAVVIVMVAVFIGFFIHLGTCDL